jgi:hypothetical protein
MNPLQHQDGATRPQPQSDVVHNLHHAHQYLSQDVLPKQKRAANLKDNQEVEKETGKEIPYSIQTMN